MVVHKTKKVNKYRAHTTHGGGHRKKRRGAGSRGGRGNAGSGKRAGHKRQGKVLGSTGFLPRRNLKPSNTINVMNFTEKFVEQLVKLSKAEKKGDVFSINLVKLGYQKLLGTGKTTLKLRLVVSEASARAVEKISAAGGEVVVSGKDADFSKSSDSDKNSEDVEVVESVEA